MFDDAACVNGVPLRLLLFLSATLIHNLFRFQFYFILLFFVAVSVFLNIIYLHSLAAISIVLCIVYVYVCCTQFPINYSLQSDLFLLAENSSQLPIKMATLYNFSFFSLCFRSYDSAVSFQFCNKILSCAGDTTILP